MSVVARYIVTQYLKVMALSAVSATGLFMVIDFFERIGSLTGQDAPASTIAAYFLLRIPHVLSEIYPAVTLMSVLISLGLLARNHEVLAFRSCGIGTWQLAVPLVIVSAIMSILMLIWNETVVPPTSSRSRDLRDNVILKKRDQGMFNASSVWFQGPQGFYNIDYFDANRNALYGLTIYETDPDFQINRIIEISEASWRNEAWDIAAGTVKNVGPSGAVFTRPLEAGEVTFKEDPRSFVRRRRKARELNSRDLQREVAALQAKGLEADSFLVDLNVKFAWPFSGLVTVLIGFPLAVRGGRRFGLAYNMGVGMVVGFSYWVTMAFAVAVGHTGGLPPVLAAWAANIIFTIFGAALYLGSDT